VADLDQLPALPARAATYPTFLAAMLDRLASTDLPELATLGTRDPSDPALALLDAWALTGDVLTFYTERIAAEGYLLTATERRSLDELARLVGYRPRPGLSASAWLAYAVDPDPASAQVTIPAGAKVQSVPDPGGLPPAPAGVPQLFETSHELQARQAWNALPARASRPMPMDTLDARCRLTFYLKGVGLGLAANDRLLVRFRRGDSMAGDAGAADLPQSRTRIVAAVEEDPISQITTVRLLPDSCAGTAAAGVVLDAVQIQRVKAAPFGATAPLQPVPPQVVGVAEVAEAAPPDTGFREWAVDLDLYDTGGANGARRVLLLDAEYPRIRAGTDVLVERPGASRKTLRISSVDTVGIARYGVTGRVTRLVLNRPWFDTPGAGVGLELLRSVTVYAQSEPLVPADEPITAPVTGAQVDVAADVADLPDARWVLVTGAPAAPAGESAPGHPLGQPLGEAVQLLGSSRHPTGGPGNAPYTTLLVTPPLTGEYDPATVVVFANVTRSTNGETKSEPAIGSGDASLARQELALHQQPLTYLAAPDADGEQAELTVRVGGVAWHEVGEIARAGPTDRVYQLITADTGDASVRFGDGVRGARLPTGTGNVSATYRVGLGRAANLGPGRLSQPLTKPLGVTSVTNPLPASGGAGPDDDEAIRYRASLGVLAMDRLVGLGDYATFTLARAGVGKAAAYRIAAGGRELVQVSVVGVGGAAVEQDSDLRAGLVAALHRYGDPSVPVEVAGCERLQLVLEATISFDPDYSWQLLEPKLLAAVDRRFGVAAQQIGHGVFASDVVACLNSVPGLIGMDIVRLGSTAGVLPADAAAVVAVAPWVAADPARPLAPAEARPGQLTRPAQLLAVRIDLPGFVVLKGTPVPTEGVSR